jgi:hypothetical protein
MKVWKLNGTHCVMFLSEFMLICAIDILYTLDSASNYSAIQKLKPWLQSQVVPMKWEKIRIFPIS